MTRKSSLQPHWYGRPLYGARGAGKEANRMLGDKIGDEKGKTTSRRILPGDDYRYVKMEVSFEGQGSTYGFQGMNMGTYTVFERIPGQLYGEGRGIFMTNEGD